VAEVREMHFLAQNFFEKFSHGSNYIHLERLEIKVGTLSHVSVL